MNWKKFLLIGIGWGLGTAIGLTAIAGLFIWYQSRPKPAKIWNTAAILSADDSPGFGVSEDGKQIQFTYALQNATDEDYEIATETEIRILVKNTDSTLSGPLPQEVASLRRPVFVPAKQKAFIRLSLVVGNVPLKSGRETDGQYHEKLRAFLREEMSNAGFAIFDERNRYQINLPSVKEKP